MCRICEMTIKGNGCGKEKILQRWANPDSEHWVRACNLTTWYTVFSNTMNALLDVKRMKGERKLFSERDGWTWSRSDDAGWGDFDKVSCLGWQQHGAVVMRAGKLLRWMEKRAWCEHRARLLVGWLKVMVRMLALFIQHKVRYVLCCCPKETVNDSYNSKS